ncbi:ELOVL fatty acid elongase 7 [Carabus blaptoides fortunei]
MDNKSDPRVKDWLMMSSPFPTMALSLCYAIFVKRIGPKLMENRKPFELKKTIIAYNAFQVIFSMWLFFEACTGGWLTTYSYRCQPVDFSMDPMALRMARGCWWYYISKFTEFFDTIQFVLVALHSGQLLFIECDYPKSFMYFIGAHAILFYLLFSNFYKQTYTKKHNKEVMTSNGQRKVTVGVCFPTQSALYETLNKEKHIYNGYTTAGNKLRNRAFVDNKS